MERRKILLGSGAALTTALAGCTGSDNDGDDDNESTESITDGETETDDTENGNESDGNGDESAADVPGFDSAALDLESDSVTITAVERAGETVEVVADSEITDHEQLYAELEPLADDLDEAVVDPDAFGDEIETVEFVVDHEDVKVVSFTVDVAWLLDYREGNLSREEFLQKVTATAE